MYFLSKQHLISGEFNALKTVIKDLQILSSCEFLKSTQMMSEINPPLVFVDLTQCDDLLQDIIDTDIHAYFVVVDTNFSSVQACVRLAKELNIRDYLSAPLSMNDIQECVDRYLQYLEHRKAADKNNLVIKDKGVHIYIETTTIKLLEGFGSYTKIHTANKIYVVSKTIKKILKLLPNQFIRTHRSFAVHQKQARALMGSTLLLHNGESVKVSKAGRQTILNHFNKAS